MIFRRTEKVYRYIRKRYHTFERAIQLFGLIIGTITVILLIVGGVAAIPCTGGSSLLPAWAGWLLFVAAVLPNFIMTARAWGISIDAITELVNGENPNNEKTATMAAFFIGLIFYFISIPLHFLHAPFVTGLQVAWESALLFFPYIVGTVSTLGRHSGRCIDHHQASIHKVTLVSLIKQWLTPEVKNEEPVKKVMMDPAFIQRGLNGMKKYLELKKDDENRFVHLGVLARHIDPNTGIKRANTYREMIDLETASEFQKVMILRNVLGNQGSKLKEVVSQEMGLKDGVNPREVLQGYIDTRVTDKAERELFDERMNKLTLFTKFGRKINHKNGSIKKDALEIQDSFIKYADFKYN